MSLWSICSSARQSSWLELPVISGSPVILSNNTDTIHRINWTSKYTAVGSNCRRLSPFPSHISSASGVVDSRSARQISQLFSTGVHLSWPWRSVPPYPEHSACGVLAPSATSNTGPVSRPVISARPPGTGHSRMPRLVSGSGIFVT